MRILIISIICFTTLIFAQDVRQLSQFDPGTLLDGDSLPTQVVAFGGKQWFSARARSGNSGIYRYDDPGATCVLSLPGRVENLHVVDNALFILVNDSQQLFLYRTDTSSNTVQSLSQTPVHAPYFAQHGVLFNAEGQTYFARATGEANLLYHKTYSRVDLENQGWLYLTLTESGSIQTAGTQATTQDINLNLSSLQPQLALQARFSSGSALRRDIQGQYFYIHGSEISLAVTGLTIDDLIAAFPSKGVIFRSSGVKYLLDDNMVTPIELNTVPNFYDTQAYGQDLIVYDLNNFGWIERTTGQYHSLPLPPAISYVSQIETFANSSKYYLRSGSQAFIYEGLGAYSSIPSNMSYVTRLKDSLIFRGTNNYGIVDIDGFRYLITQDSQAIQRGENDDQFKLTKSFFALNAWHHDEPVLVISDSSQVGTQIIANDHAETIEHFGPYPFFNMSDGSVLGIQGQPMPCQPQYDLATLDGSTFIAAMSDHGLELWQTDGTALHTEEIANIHRDWANQTILDQVVVKGTLYFLKDTPQGRHLYRSNGLTLARPMGLASVDHLFSSGDRLFFTRNDGLYEWGGLGETRLTHLHNIGQVITYGEDLVFVSQSDQQTYLIRLSAGQTSTLAEDVEMGLLEVVGETIYFQKEGRPYSCQGDAASVQPLFPDNSDLRLSQPLSATISGSQLVMMIEDSQPTPYLSSGDAASTYPLTRERLWHTETSNPATDFVHVGEQLYFPMGHQVWSTTKLESETQLAFALPENLRIARLFHNEFGFLIMAQSGNQSQLWRSRGDQGSTYKLRDFERADATGAILADGILYFPAHRPTTGQELMRSDGTAAGTYLLSDIWPGAYSSLPRSLIQAGGQIYFLATAPDTGDQLYTMCFAPEIRFSAESACAFETGKVRVPHAGEGATYEWQVSGASVITADGPELTYQANDSDVTVALTISLASGCFASNDMVITTPSAAPTATPIIVGPDEICTNQRKVNFEVANSDPELTYTWQLPEGAAIISGQGSDQIVVDWGTHSGAVGVVASNACGQTAQATQPVTTIAGPEQLDAGPNQLMCGTSTTLAATLSAPYAGTWSIIEGEGGSFVNANDPNTTFNGQPGREYRLRWQVADPECDAQFDEVRITFTYAALNANTGMHYLGGTACVVYGENILSLSAVLPPQTHGWWEILSGEGGSFDDATDPKTQFHVLPNETYQLRWTVDYGLCGTASDTVTFTTQEYRSGYHNAQQIPIGVPTALIPPVTPAVGTWSLLEGPDLDPSQIADLNDPHTLFTPKEIGTYTFNFHSPATTCSNWDSDFTNTVYVDLPTRMPYRLNSEYDYTTIVEKDEPLIDSQGNLYFQIRKNGALLSVVTDGQTIETFSHVKANLYLAGDNPVYLNYRKLLVGSTHDVEVAFESPDPGTYLGSWNNRAAFADATMIYTSDGTLEGSEVLHEFATYVYSIALIGDRFLYCHFYQGNSKLWQVDGPGQEPLLLGSFDESPYDTRFFELGDKVMIIADGNLLMTQAPGEAMTLLRNLSGFQELTQVTGRLFVHLGETLYTYTQDGEATQTYDIDRLLGNNGSIAIYMKDDQIYAADGTHEATLIGSGFTPTDLLFLQQKKGYITFDYAGGFWKSDGTSAGTRELTRAPDRPMGHFEDMGGTYIYRASSDSPINGYSLMGFTPEPELELQAAQSICTRGIQQATLAGVGDHAQIEWQIGGGFFTEAPVGHSVQYTANGSGVVNLTAHVSLPGHVYASQSQSASADPAQLHQWGTSLTIRDLVQHFSQCPVP